MDWPSPSSDLNPIKMLWGANTLKLNEFYIVEW